MKAEDRMKLADVPAYVLTRTGVTRSRATIYNWVSKGVTITGQTFKLQTDTHAGQLFTSTAYVDSFLATIEGR